MASCLLAYYFYIGMFCSDDGRYLVGMAKIISGEPILIHSAAERRVFFLLPGAFFMWLGGEVDWAVSAYLVFYLLMPQVSWSLAEHFMDWRRAAWAGFITAFMPLAYTNAGAILPDLMAGVFLGLALINLVAWHQRSGSGTDLSHAAVRLGSSGTLLAAAVLVKESSLVLLPVPLFYFAVIAIRQRLRLAALLVPLPFVAGMVIVFALDAIAFKIIAGTWHSSLLNATTPHDFRGFIASQGLHPLDRFTYLMGQWPSDAWFFVGALLASVLVALSVYDPRAGVRDPAGVLLVVAFFVLPFLYFTIGTSSLSEYIPPVIQGRYYLPLLVPGSALLVIGYSWTVSRFAGQDEWLLRTRHGLGLLAVVFVLYSTGTGMKAAAPERGIAHAAQAKESYLIAMNDLQKRFPRVPVVNTLTGWTTDLVLCRAVLGEVRDGDDIANIRKVTLDEHKLEELSRPFIIIGIGDYIAQEGQSPLVDEVRRGVEEGWLARKEVGDYFADSLDDAGVWYLPRQSAVQRREGARPGEFTISNNNGDPRAEVHGLRAFLVVENPQ